MFKRKKDDSKLEISFKTILPLIENLNKKDYERLKDAMDLGWQAVQKLRNVKTIEEHEFEDIDKVEKKLDRIVAKKERKDAKN